MPTEIAFVLAAALAAIGLVGIIVWVLPGSITIMVGLLVWAVWGHGALRWPVVVVGTILLIAGSVASTLLTKRSLDRKQIPRWLIGCALLVGFVLSLIFPLVGMVGGFLGALLVCEAARISSLKGALATTWVALKSIGTGMLVELACAAVALTLFATSVMSWILFN